MSARRARDAGGGVQVRIAPPWPSITEPAMTRGNHGSRRKTARASERGPSFHGGMIAGS